MSDAVLVLGILLLIVLCIVFLVAGIRRIIKGPSPRQQAGAVAVAANANGLGLTGSLTGHGLREVDGFFEWKHVYGKGFKVPVSAVQTVMVEKAGWGKAVLKVIGAGTELAKVTDLPAGVAEQAQMWMLERLAK